MRIAQINAVYEYSSTGRTTKEMHNYLKTIGYESIVFNSIISKAEENVFMIGSKFDHKLHALLSRLLGLQGFFSYLATRKLIKQLDDFAPNILILRNLHANYINFPLLLKYIIDRKIPTILVLHDFWFMTGHCCYYTEDNCVKWQTVCHNCPILHKYNRSLFFDNSKIIFEEKRNLFGQIKDLAVVGVSDWTAKEATKSLLKNAKIIRRIYNWIDLDVFKPKESIQLRNELNIAEDDFVILGVAQIWVEQKGLPLFISVANHFPEYKIVLVGSMPSGNNLPKNVVSVGAINKADQLATYYSMADVFLNPSIQETFGKVSAESLACGTPVIANNVTANPEIVGDCGILVNNDLHEICEAIDEIRSNTKKIYSDKCVKRVQALFNKESNLNEYYKLFEELAR